MEISSEEFMELYLKIQKLQNEECDELYEVIGRIYHSLDRLEMYIKEKNIVDDEISF